MDDVRVLGIVESATVGRWVLATIGGYDDSVYYELTFAPGFLEWDEVKRHLPAHFLLTDLRAVSGDLLGRKQALLATIA